MFTNIVPRIKKHLTTLVACLVFFFFIACGGGGGGSTPPPPPPPPPPSAPTISAITPNSGNELGGTQVSITGTNFVSGATVTFGNASAFVTNVVPNAITLTTPAFAPVAVDVTVKNPDGQSVTLKSGYTFTHLQTPQEAARAIMGKNYFGVEENQKYFGATFSTADAALYYDIPYLKSTLLDKKDTHILVLGLPGISILDLQAKLPQGTIAFSSSWLASQPFAAKQSTGGAWFLVRKSVQLGSFNLNENVQYGTLLQGKEAVPDALMLTYAFAGYYMATGEVLMSGVFGRTLQHVDVGTGYPDSVIVGGNAYSGKIGIGNVPTAAVDPTIGLASWWYRDGLLVP